MKQAHISDVNLPQTPAWPAWLDDAGLDGPVRAFAAVLTGQADSRSALSALLKVRSTTVSAWVAAMVRAGLVTELLLQPDGRGRPQGHLVAHPDRLLVPVLMVHSQSLHIVVVNLLGQVLWQDSAAVASDAGNAEMADSLRGLQERARQYIPADSGLAGVAFSIAGLLNLERSEWVFSSRWPGIRNLPLPGCAVPARAPVFVARNMDAQLQARYLRREQVGPGRRTLLLHWGFGIGVTFGPAARGSRDGGHGFGEVGHWQLPGGRVRCRCGQFGCLETVAALWSIGPLLLGKSFDAAVDETQVATLLQGAALVRRRVFQRALREVVLALTNLCRLFFPSEVVVSGPFIENAAVWNALKAALAAQDLLVGLPMPRMERQGAGHQLEQEGASMPLLVQGLKELMDGALDTEPV